VVAASGNSGDKGSPVEEPGVCLGVVAVGSVNRNLDVSAFSSRHSYLTISAPGESIPTLSRIPGAAYIGDGTSQATAMVSAALALVWSKYPAESNRQILTRLLSTATDRGSRGRDSAYGYGVIDPPAAMAAPVPTATAPNSVFAAIAPVLALEAATDKAQHPRLVRAAGNPQASLGQPTVGRPPTLLGPEFRLLAGATIACAAGAVLLLALAFRRRRRRPARLPALATAQA
jgi:subtilisin family serine protease